MNSLNVILCILVLQIKLHDIYIIENLTICIETVWLPHLSSVHTSKLVFPYVDITCYNSRLIAAIFNPIDTWIYTLLGLAVGVNIRARNVKILHFSQFATVTTNQLQIYFRHIFQNAVWSSYAPHLFQERIYVDYHDALKWPHFGICFEWYFLDHNVSVKWRSSDQSILIGEA